MGTGVFMLVLGLAGTAVCAAAIRGRLRQAPVQAMLTNYTGYLLLSLAVAATGLIACLQLVSPPLATLLGIPTLGLWVYAGISLLLPRGPSTTTLGGLRAPRRGQRRHR